MGEQDSKAIEPHEPSGHGSAALEQLAWQVERGHRFTQSALGEGFLRLGELETFVHGVIDALLDKGVITSEETTRAVSNARRELTERGDLNGPRTVVRLEQFPGDSTPAVKVDCQARMHVCHAVCCRLHFALSIPEVESGSAKWDLGRPYFIRHDSHGMCVHFDHQFGGGCSIYADRPGICRSYSCANDSRIWKDFDKMELNTEWIESNLPDEEEPRLIAALMHGPDRLADARNSESSPNNGGTER